MVYGFFMQYIELALQGNDTIELRLQMFQHQKAVLQEQLKELQHTIEMVNYNTGTMKLPKQLVRQMFRKICRKQTFQQPFRKFGKN